MKLVEEVYNRHHVDGRLIVKLAVVIVADGYKLDAELREYVFDMVAGAEVISP